jgi:hypothetical protein
MWTLSVTTSTVQTSIPTLKSPTKKNKEKKIIGRLDEKDSPMKQMEQFIGTKLKIKLIKIMINKREQSIATCAYYMTTTSNQIEFLNYTYLSHAGFTLISIELFCIYLLNSQFIVIYTI